MMLTGVVTFAQETPKKATKDAVKNAATTATAEKKTEVSKTTEVKQEANGAKKVETTTATKTTEAAQPTAPAQSATTAKKPE